MTTLHPEPSATVYSWYMPEIADLIDGPTGIAKCNYPTELFRSNYAPGLDDLHESLVDDYLKLSLSEIFRADSILQWNDQLPNAYYTNGSSEGLFHLIARHQTYYPGIPLYQFAGEYQGYDEYAKALGTFIHTVEHGEDFTKLPPGVFIVSVPSAVDGNNVAPSVIDRICEQHYVIIDCAYAGMARTPMDYKLTLNPRVAAVVGSMSKPFGLYYHRIGFLWSQDPVASLYGNKWFKNVFSIEVGKAVFEEYSAQWLATQYRPWQAQACQEASALLGVTVTPSDVWLLGYVLPGAKDAIPFSLTPFKRGPAYRLCLSPYYMERQLNA